MAVSNELAKPDTADDFEAMCHQLYRAMWRDSSCKRVGRGGQQQFGVDILGHDGSRSAGVQCKHFNKKPFTLAVVLADIEKAEQSELQIELLLFATTAASDSTLAKQVHELSETRRKQGKFLVSVDAWGDICGHIRMHPDIGRAFIPGFPGGAIHSIAENTTKTLLLMQATAGSGEAFQAAVLSQLDKISGVVSMQGVLVSSPDAAGDEAEPRIAASLDFIRDRLQEGKCDDAMDLLKKLGDPNLFKDRSSRFRWHSNRAAVDLLQGRHEEAAARYLEAFKLAPDNEKAIANRVRAYALQENMAAARVAFDDGIARYPESAILWSLHLDILRRSGHPHPEASLPKGLEDTDDLLYTRGRLCSLRGDHAGALDLLRRCLSVKPDSIEAQSAYLADALAWTTSGCPLSHFGQIGADHHSVLSDAIARLEPVEQRLAAIQAEPLSQELYNNVSLALELLGIKERCQTLAQQALARHPLLEGPLRLRIRQLDERDDVAAIRALTDQRLGDIPPSILALLAESAANQGNLAWHEKVMAVVEAKCIEASKLRDLRAISLHARWRAGDRDQAIEAARAHVKADPSHVLAHIVLGHMLRLAGNHEGASAEASACLRIIPMAAASTQMLQVAELLYLLRRFNEAAPLLQKLVVRPGGDELTYQLLVSLVSADSRQQAQRLLDALSPDIRNSAPIRRVEVDLARRVGDWRRMVQLLAPDVSERPGDASVAVHYAGALLRAGDGEELSKFLTSDPPFSKAAVDDEIEFAKYQLQTGLCEIGMRRLYRLFRANPSSSKVAGYLLMQGLMLPEQSLVGPPQVAGPGTAVRLQGPADSWWVMLDPEARVGESWPELVSPASEVARRLLGATTDDKVHVRRGMAEVEARVVELRSLIGYAAEKAQELVASAADPHGPIWSMKVVRDDGELDIDALLQMGKRRREQTNLAFQLYRENPLPLSVLAKMLGKEIETVLLDWPSQLARLFVGIGSHEELQASRTTIDTRGLRYVVDLVTLVELVRHKAMNSIVRLLGRPLVPQTVREAVMRSLQITDVSSSRQSAVVGEQDGHLTRAIVPAAYHQSRSRLLRAVLQAIDNECEAVPALGPASVTDELRQLARMLDRATLDAFYLCLERDAVLLSEDGSVRFWASTVSVRAAIGVQPALLAACDRGFLSKAQYADVVAEKIQAGHDFVSIRAQDLLLLAERTPHRVSRAVRDALDTFRRPTLEIASGWAVASAFLRGAAGELAPEVAGAYATLLVDVLTHGRPELAATIEQGFSRMLQVIYGRGGRRLAPWQRRTFRGLLRRTLATDD